MPFLFYNFKIKTKFESSYLLLFICVSFRHISYKKKIMIKTHQMFVIGVLSPATAARCDNLAGGEMLKKFGLEESKTVDSLFAACLRRLSLVDKNSQD